MLSIKTEISRALAKKPGADIRAAEQGLAAAMTGALAEVVRYRVSKYGRIADGRAPDWDSERKPKMVSAVYPDQGQGPVKRSGAKYYKTSKVYHEEVGALRGAYDVTGGMWSGLSRVINTATLVDALFRSRSAGQDARIQRGKSRPLKVNNAFKAWTVLTQHHVNVLAYTELEQRQVRDAGVQVLAAALARQFAVDWDGPRPADGAVIDVFRAALGSREMMRW